jgi:signal transduction histidine kinase
LEINTDVTERRLIQENLATLSSRLLKVQDDERRRIARELHDSLGQLLTAAKMELDLIQNAGQPVSADDVREPLRHIQQALGETRTISHLLHPPLLDEAGFTPAARGYVDEFGKRSGIYTTFVVPSELPRLSRNVETALFRILQEGLTNVHRHSGSNKVEIQIRRDAASLVLLIRDCGHGMPKHLLEKFKRTGAEAGVGLSGIRERIREIGGMFEIESTDKGTQLTITVPIEEQEAKHSLTPESLMMQGKIDAGKDGHHLASAS